MAPQEALPLHPCREALSGALFGVYALAAYAVYLGVSYGFGS